MGIGAPELLIVLLVVLVIFGGSQLPKLARSLGQAQKEFKQGLADGNKPEGDGERPPAPPPPPSSN
jgi:sec-independent protein translocase protein TatA